MEFKKGNKWWERRSTHGRKKLFASAGLLWKAFCEYVEQSQLEPWVEVETKSKSIVVDKMPTDVAMDEVETKTKKTATPLTMTGFCVFIGCNEAYFRQFKSDKVKCTIDFSTVIQQIESVIERQLFEGAAVGAFNGNIISRKLGLADKMIQENINMNYNTDITAEEAKAIAAALNNKV